MNVSLMSGPPFSPKDAPASVPGFRSVPRTGVTFVTAEAAKLGYEPGSAGWCNLGQGQPETGELPGAPPRVHAVRIGLGDQEYAPLAGIGDLRAAVADLYNRLYRRGLRSLYTAENVCIAGGGRAALARAAACLGTVNLGHFLPDYTAYEELLDVFKSFTAIPVLLDAPRSHAFDAHDLRREIEDHGLSALLLSNPSNPTGNVICGEELERWVETARRLDCTLLCDEFYSHYVYGDDSGEPLSAARHVEDVDRDPVILFDGLTKNWRYPGWRVSWAVGPRRAIESMAAAGSFLDGGGSRPLQRAAIPLLEAAHVRAETAAIQRAFRAKRDRLVTGLRALGVRFDGVANGTFYAWGSVAGLPAPLDDGMAFFRAALGRKVIVVPGEFFDVNPGRRRRGLGGRFRQHVRFSFGPELAVLDRALERLSSLGAG